MANTNTPEESKDTKPFLTISQIAKESIPARSPIWILDRWWVEKSQHNGQLPKRGDIDPIELGADILPWIFTMIAMRDGPTLDYRFRLIGTSNAALVGYDATGMLASELFHGSDRAGIKASFDETLNSGEPTFWKATIPHKQNFPISVYRALYPLADDGETVDHLIGSAIPDSVIVKR